MWKRLFIILPPPPKDLSDFSMLKSSLGFFLLTLLITLLITPTLPHPQSELFINFPLSKSCYDPPPKKKGAIKKLFKKKKNGASAASHSYLYRQYALPPGCFTGES